MKEYNSQGALSWEITLMERISAFVSIPNSTLLASPFGTPHHQQVLWSVGDCGPAISLISSSHTLLSSSPLEQCLSLLLKHELPCQPPPGDRFRFLILGSIPWVLQSPRASLFFPYLSCYLVPPSTSHLTHTCLLQFSGPPSDFLSCK